MASPSAPATPHPATALRNGLTAAAITGTVLALATPALTGLDRPPPADATVVALSAAGGVPSETPAAVSDWADGAVTQVRTIAAIAPVMTSPAEPPLPEVATAELIKAVGIVEEERIAEEARLAREGRALCDTPLGGLGAVQPWVRDTARFLSCLYEQPPLIGVASRSRASDHPSGHAVDLMARGEHGDRIAECALANQRELGITYVIWKQRINHGNGWQGMADRGGDTANHYDHVHISFARSAPGGEPTVEVCDD